MAPNVDCNLCVTVSKFGKWGACGKRPILADFAAYHLNNFNGKINGSRRENIRSPIRNQNDKSGCQRVTSSCLFLEGVPTMAPVTFHAWFCFLECIPHCSQSAFLLYFILFWKWSFLTRFPRSCTLICALALTTLRQSIPSKDTDLKVYLHFCLQRSMKPETTPECLKNYTKVSVQHVYFVDPLKIACS